MKKTTRSSQSSVNEHDRRVNLISALSCFVRSEDKPNLKLEAPALCTIAAFVLSLSAPPSTLAHNGAAGIVKDRMGKFEASEEATKRIE